MRYYALKEGYETFGKVVVQDHLLDFKDKQVVEHVEVLYETAFTKEISYKEAVKRGFVPFESSEIDVEKLRKETAKIAKEIEKANKVEDPVKETNEGSDE